MKLQLDTSQKTIKVEEIVNFGELIELLEKLLPYETWKQWSLETNSTIIQWDEPIYIDRWPYHTPYPWWQQPITCGTETLTTSVYNIEVQ